MKFKSIKGYFSKVEIALWVISVSLIIISFSVFDRRNYIILAASLIGATSLIFNAKGNPIGQVLIIIFGILYGIVSYTFAYYGEMITYLGMTAPMAIVALIAWLKNPYNGNKAEVKVNRLMWKEIILMAVLTVAVTIAFYFILWYFNTANLLPSTLSVTTSFIAAYLTFRRSPYFAIVYAANDIVLIVLWILATLTDISYLSVTICFAVFLVNDIYSFINWLKMRKRQHNREEAQCSEK
ncbi:MAG: nicotinamide mononucleotide transporter [Clostridiales bacterium]|nr:nicotinamide mononucleotide transporter [Clostridiales bacterium]